MIRCKKRGAQRITARLLSVAVAGIALAGSGSLLASFEQADLDQFPEDSKARQAMELRGKAYTQAEYDAAAGLYKESLNEEYNGLLSEHQKHLRGVLLCNLGQCQWTTKDGWEEGARNFEERPDDDATLQSLLNGKRINSFTKEQFDNERLAGSEIAVVQECGLGDVPNAYLFPLLDAGARVCFVVKKPLEKLFINSSAQQVSDGQHTGYGVSTKVVGDPDYIVRAMSLPFLVGQNMHTIPAWLDPSEPYVKGWQKWVQKWRTVGGRKPIGLWCHSKVAKTPGENLLRNDETGSTRDFSWKQVVGGLGCEDFCFMSFHDSINPVTRKQFNENKAHSI